MVILSSSGLWLSQELIVSIVKGTPRLIRVKAWPRISLSRLIDFLNQRFAFPDSQAQLIEIMYFPLPHAHTLHVEL